jgi:hypothetical protein
MTGADVQVEALVSTNSHEWELSLYFATFLILLMVGIVVSNYTAHKWHLHWLPEAAGTTLALFCCHQFGSLLGSPISPSPL